jgi:hypothetical protein
MALQVRTRLTPSYDWKSILVEDITGTGITGYGTNQDPVGFRRLSDIVSIRLELTSPSLITKIIDITGGTLTTFKTTLQYTVTNLALGYLIDEPIEDGIWTVVYTPFFSNDSVINLSATTPNTSLTYLTSNKTSFLNATKLIKIAGTVYSNILSNLIGVTTSILSTNNTQISMTGSEYYVGLGITGYTPIAREIKECLDGKVADLSVCDCGCLELQTIKLVNMYLLYDAMFVNCAANNITKAQQIFDLLTTYCDKDCGCNS